MVSTYYLGKRIVIAVLSIMVIASLVFGMTTALPGSAAEIVLGTSQTEEAVDELEEEMGLDRPLHERYVDFMVGTFTLNWGDSLVSNEPVKDRIVPRLQRTLELSIFAMLMTIVTAIPLGIVTASRRGSALDNVVTSVSYLGISMPDFVSGSLLLLVFTTGTLDILPNGGYVPFNEGVVPWMTHLILPAIALNVIVFSYVLRQTRSSMIQTLESKYIRTARLRGAPETRVLFKHALRNGLLPTVTVLALNFGWMMGSVVIVEEIFTYPGLGELIVQAISQRDLPVIQAAIMVPTITFILSNLAADIIYTLLDPRITLGDS
jgi:peptide/nickel transport system permease protein